VCILAVLIHEFSHAVVARHYGIKAQRITLLPFGASLTIDCAFLKKSAQTAILFAGALGNMSACCIVGSMLWLLPDFFHIFGMFIFANMTVALMNLLPFYPLDGGKIVELFAPRWLVRALYVISNIVFVALFIVAVFYLYSWSIALFAACMVFTVNSQSKTEYSASLAQMLEILYNEKHGTKKRK
jgi:Zn-dependent protease